MALCSVLLSAKGANFMTQPEDAATVSPTMSSSETGAINQFQDAPDTQAQGLIANNVVHPTP